MQHIVQRVRERDRIVPRFTVGDGDRGEHHARTQRFCRRLQADGIAHCFPVG